MNDASTHPLDRWSSPQTIIALTLVVILGCTVAAVFWYHDAQTVSQTVGTVGGIAGMVAGYYFGSSATQSRGADERRERDKP